jgi:dolichol-phosphate mannosyltransferase
MRSLVVLPTYNEVDNITQLLHAVFAALPSTDVLVVDDNSPDGTGKLVDEIRETNPQLYVMHRSGKLGLGTAYIQGFHYAIDRGYDFVFEMDSDFSHDPKDLPRLLEAAQQADLVIGSRYVAGGSTPDWSVVRRFISRGGNIFARCVLGIPLHDCTGGFRCYRTTALQQINTEFVTSEGYAFQVEMAYLFWQRGLRVKETPIVFIDRRVGKSKMSKKIFLEAVRWVLLTRVRGHQAARVAPTNEPVVRQR